MNLFPKTPASNHTTRRARSAERRPADVTMKVFSPPSGPAALLIHRADKATRETFATAVNEMREATLIRSAPIHLTPAEPGTTFIWL